MTIHGDHYDARISADTIAAAGKPGPWPAARATELLNFLARSVETDLVLLDNVKTYLEDHNLDILDILSSLENGTCFSGGMTTTRENIFRYSILGFAFGTLLRVDVIPSPSNASLNIVEIELTSTHE